MTKKVGFCETSEKKAQINFRVKISVYNVILFRYTDARQNVRYFAHIFLHRVVNKVLAIYFTNFLICNFIYKKK